MYILYSIIPNGANGSCYMLLLAIDIVDISESVDQNEM